MDSWRKIKNDWAGIKVELQDWLKEVYLVLERKKKGIKYECIIEISKKTFCRFDECL